MKQAMTPQIAHQNLANVAAAYKGSLEEHQALQESLAVFRSLIAGEEAANQARASKVAKKMVPVPKAENGKA